MRVERNLRKTRVGVVVSDKMDKTVVVALEDFVRHSLYGKAVKKTVIQRNGYFTNILDYLNTF